MVSFLKIYPRFKQVKAGIYVPEITAFQFIGMIQSGNRKISPFIAQKNPVDYVPTQKAQILRGVFTSKEPSIEGKLSILQEGETSTIDQQFLQNKTTSIIEGETTYRLNFVNTKFVGGEEIRRNRLGGFKG